MKMIGPIQTLGSIPIPSDDGRDVLATLYYCLHCRLDHFRLFQGLNGTLYVQCNRCSNWSRYENEIGRGDNPGSLSFSTAGTGPEKPGGEEMRWETHNTNVEDHTFYELDVPGPWSWVVSLGRWRMPDEHQGKWYATGLDANGPVFFPAGLSVDDAQLRCLSIMESHVYATLLALKIMTTSKGEA